MLKKCLCALLALCLLVSLAACASAGASTESADENTIIECPLPGIEWGMTKAEVWEQLSFPEETDASTIDFFTDVFSGEQTNCGAILPKYLAWENPQIAGMDHSYYAGDVDNYRGVNMVFSKPINGEQYLVSIILSLRAKDDAAYESAMTAAYGKPVDPWGDGEKMIWISGSEGTALDEAALSACEEAGMYLVPYYEEELQTWHIQPVAYLWWSSLDAEDIVDGMRNYTTEFNAYPYVMLKLYEEGVLPQK